MNKQELIDKAVHELSGVWPLSISSCRFISNVSLSKLYDASTSKMSEVCNRDEFKQRAKELGYINGYRWGVEYPNDGEKPDLPDDVGLEYWTGDFGSSESNVISLNWSQDSNYCYPIIKFKITDQRYKPADTSYLDSVSEIPESKSNAESVSDWYDYEAHKPLKPAPVGEKLIVDCFDKGWKDAVVIGEFERWNWLDIDGLGLETVDVCRIKPLDYNRKAEAEKKRVVAEAQKHCRDLSSHDLRALYDLGYLRTPSK